MAYIGPHEPASVVLGLLVGAEHIHGVELLGRVVAVTVVLSVLLRGVSAGSLADRYGRRHEETTTAGRELHEGTPVPEAVQRRRPASRRGRTSRMRAGMPRR